MKLICCTICYPRSVWPALLDDAALDGWRELELVAIPGMLHVNLEEIEAAELGREFKQRGMLLYAVHAGVLSVSDKGAKERNVRYIKRTIELSSELGFQQIVFTGGSRSESLESLAGALSEIVPVLEQSKARIGLENHPDNRIEFPEDYDYLLGQVNHPQVGITVDTGIFHGSGIDACEVIRAYDSKVYHVHLKDHVGKEGASLGKGEVDLARIVGVLKDVGYRRALSVELESKYPQPGESARAREYAEKLLEKAGILSV